MTLRDDLVLRLETENDELREKIASLESMLGIRIEVPLVFGLTNQQAKVLGMLMKREIVTKEMAFTALYGLRTGGADVEIKIIDVFICHVRRKLKPFEIEIETVWGQGYRMSPEAKAIASKVFEQANAA
jgi:DNA-binding response OmpR family regulator